jgi:HAD superfamily hydrolase (TIGR01509 family)
MDGTIVDTEPYWMAAETELVTAHGGSWSHEDAVQLVGSGLWHSAEVLRAHGVDLEPDEIIETLTTMVLSRVELEVPWRPGARELLEELAARDIPTALVTMSIRRMAVQIAEGLPTPFRVIVAGDDVENSKPHPEPYLRAAELLGVRAEDCIAIEDSAPGVASAVAAGSVVIGIPLHGRIPESSDHTVWPTLDGRGVDALNELYRSRVELRRSTNGTTPTTTTTTSTDDTTTGERTSA